MERLTEAAIAALPPTVRSIVVQAQARPGFAGVRNVETGECIEVGFSCGMPIDFRKAALEQALILESAAAETVIDGPEPVLQGGVLWWLYPLSEDGYVA